MIEIQIELLKRLLPRTFHTLRSNSAFNVQLHRDVVYFETKSENFHYSIESISNILTYIINEETVLAPRNWKDYVEFKRHFYYLRALIINYIYHEGFHDLTFLPVGFKSVLSDGFRNETGNVPITLEDHDTVYSISYEKIFPPEEEKFEVVPINYATSRMESVDDSYFSGERDDKINYGVMNVSIPKYAHRPGRIERPLRLFGIQLSADAPDKHFIIHSQIKMDKCDFYKQLSESDNSDKIIIFIHGFNVSFRDATFKAAQIKYDLKISNPILLISWPSYSKVKDYAYDKQSTISSSSIFIPLFDELENNHLFENKEIFVLAHSMGNLLLSQILRNIQKGYSRFKNVVLAAADITQFEFLKIYIEYYKRIFSKISLYVNENDYALKFSKLINKDPLVGDSSIEICVHADIDTIDTTGYDGKLGELYHSYYASNEMVLNDIRESLINSLSVNQRGLIPAYAKNNMQYWKLPINKN